MNRIERALHELTDAIKRAPSPNDSDVVEREAVIAYLRRQIDSNYDEDDAETRALQSAIDGIEGSCHRGPRQ